MSLLVGLAGMMTSNNWKIEGALSILARIYKMYLYILCRWSLLHVKTV